ncbi:hypothetical protein FCV25MIE_26041 [Fagus crenata]
MIHAKNPDNLQAMGTLALSGTSEIAPSSSPSLAPVPASGPSSVPPSAPAPIGGNGNNESSSSRTRVNLPNLDLLLEKQAAGILTGIGFEAYLSEIEKSKR